ncbi:MAG: PE-PPE domain-containing protein [Mycolicibacterium rufum]|nr:PE-PPE domain-containing protein [Mycolicibacterium rufum]
MRLRARSAAAVVLAAAITVLFTVVSVVVSASAGAGTALIMGGNAHSLSVPQDTPEYIEGYVDGVAVEYLAPSGLCGPSCSLVAVYTPEQFRFVTGIFDMTFDESVAVGQANLDDCVGGTACTVTLAPYTETGSQPVADGSYVIFGYSESSTIASIQKLQLIAHPVAPTVDFLLVANPNRPNGGILERFVGAYIPILGVTFSGATPTFSPQPTPLTTVDVARQYDGWADFPTNPLNLLSDVNAFAGTVLLHGKYFGVGTPQLQGQYQDSTYYLIPRPVTPLLMPLTWIPLVGKPLAIALDPATRVLVETGYDRTINPGQPTPAKPFYAPNLIRTARNFAVAIPTGWDDAISYVTGDPGCRPFHTAIPSSPYGVGGPPMYTGAVDPYGDPTPYLEPSVPASTAAAQPTDAAPPAELAGEGAGDGPAGDTDASPQPADATSEDRPTEAPSRADAAERDAETTGKHRLWGSHLSVNRAARHLPRADVAVPRRDLRIRQFMFGHPPISSPANRPNGVMPTRK